MTTKHRTANVDGLDDHLLEWCRGMGLVKARGKQRTDSTRILACS